MSNLGFFQRLKNAFNPSGDDTASKQKTEAVNTSPEPSNAQPVSSSETKRTVELNTTLFAKQCLKLVGGYENMSWVEACVTRVRLTLKDNSVVTDEHLKAIGAAAVVRVGDKHLQVVVGPMAQDIAEEIKKIPVTENLSKIEVPA